MLAVLLVIGLVTNLYAKTLSLINTFHYKSNLRRRAPP
jgi:hypothetical protein